MSAAVELRKDADELRRLCELAERQRVKDILTIDLRKLETEIIAREDQEKKETEGREKKETEGRETSATKLATVTVVPSQTHVRNVDIKTYAWDQSDKFMKIYATVNGVQNVPKENVTCDFTEKGFQMRCTGVSNTNYRCSVSNLSEKIVPSESYTKVKSDTVLIMLKKKETGKTWPYVTEVEKKAKEKSTKKPDVDASADPQESLMGLMKQMYDDGDDEMKRTISKAWTESRDKKSAGDMML